MQGIVSVLLLAVYVEAGYNVSSLSNKGGSVSETTAKVLILLLWPTVLTLVAEGGCCWESQNTAFDEKTSSEV